MKFLSLLLLFSCCAFLAADIIQTRYYPSTRESKMYDKFLDNGCSIYTTGNGVKFLLALTATDKIYFQTSVCPPTLPSHVNSVETYPINQMNDSFFIDTFNPSKVNLVDTIPNEVVEHYKNWDKPAFKVQGFESNIDCSSNGFTSWLPYDPSLSCEQAAINLGYIKPGICISLPQKDLFGQVQSRRLTCSHAPVIRDLLNNVFVPATTTSTITTNSLITSTTTKIPVASSTVVKTSTKTPVVSSTVVKTTTKIPNDACKSACHGLSLGFPVLSVKSGFCLRFFTEEDCLKIPNSALGGGSPGRRECLSKNGGSISYGCKYSSSCCDQTANLSLKAPVDSTDVLLAEESGYAQLNVTFLFCILVVVLQLLWF